MLCFLPSSSMLTFVAIIVTVFNNRCSVSTIVHTNSLFNSRLCLTKMLRYDIWYVNYKAFNMLTSINVYSIYIDNIMSMRKMLINVIYYWFYIILLHNTAPPIYWLRLWYCRLMSLYNIIWFYGYELININ